MSKTILTIAAILICGYGAHGHEMGTTRVTVSFQEGRAYEIELVTDAQSLLDKLSAYAGNDTAQMQASLASRDEQFRRRMKIAFDAAEVRPGIAYAVTPARGGGPAAMATIRLTGAVPKGSRRFTWNYGWTFASYALMIRNAATD